MTYSGFPSRLIPALLCPQDGASLVFSGQEQASHILTGMLVCGHCASAYVIKDGIVHLIEGQGALDELLEKEIMERDTQAAEYDTRLSARYHKEVASTLRIVGDMKGKAVIEYGAGTGRFTALCAPDSGSYLAVDFSLSSLNILSKKALPGSLGLVLADAISMRTAAAFFDVALTFQFVEHIPTEERRAEFYRHVRETLVPNGSFICSLYHQDLRRVISGKSSQGLHGNGIFYHYFSRSEFRNELKTYFTPHDIRYIDITLPLETRLNLSPETGGRLSRILEDLPILNRFGHLLIARTTKFV